METNQSAKIAFARSAIMAVGILLFIVLGYRGLSTISDKEVVMPKPRQDSNFANQLNLPVFTSGNFQTASPVAQPSKPQESKSPANNQHTLPAKATPSENRRHQRPSRPDIRQPLSEPRRNIIPTADRG